MKETIQPMFSEQAGNKRNPVNVEKLLSTAASYWPLFLFSVVLALSLGYVYLRYSTPVYMVNAKLLIEDHRKGSADVDLLQGLGMRPRIANVDNEMEVIKSMALMERVVSDLDLNIQYISKGAVTSSSLYTDKPITFYPLFDDNDVKQAHKYEVELKGNAVAIKEGGKAWNAKVGDTVNLSAGPFAILKNSNKGKDIDGFDMVVSPVEQVALGLSHGVIVNNANKLVSIINLSVADAIPQRGEDVLNKLMEVYKQSNVDDRNRIANGTMDFINTRLVLVGSELTDIEKEIEGFKRENEMTDLEAQSALLVSSTGDYARQLSEKELQLSLVEALEKYIRDNANSKRIVPASLLGGDPVLDGIFQKYNDLQAQREKLLLTNTENSPYIQNLDQQLASLRGDMTASLASSKRQVQVSINQLNKMSGRLDARIRQVPAKQRVYLEYSRQQAIKQELYLFLLKKREETAISKSATTSDAKIIDVARRIPRPVSPNRRMVFLSALVFGLIVPAAGLFIKDLLNIRIRSREDVSQATNMSVLAEIGHSDGDKAVPAAQDSRGLVAEQFRGLRTNLQFLFTDENEKVIMVTSSMSGEGKSFVAINMAAIMAISGKKVLLMEMDLRKPKISTNLGLDNSVGFSNYAIGQADLNKVIVPSGVVDNFFVLPSGPVPPNPAELVMLHRTKDLFDTLKDTFDFIIVDTAPVGLVTDAQLLSRYADAVLYIVREGYTYRQQVKTADEIYRSGKMPKMNIVMNDAKIKSAGYGYGYGYYGNGYFEESPEKNRISSTFRKLRKRFSRH
ncbi:MAG: polysaccharide biosynthesis tyrosine autokinase [Sphingobacteriales bacterium]|nr:MAG: polysaccharide biosynthesis tyrosine autokinase [Sphingobacteriales bacterium]